MPRRREPPPPAASLIANASPLADMSERPRDVRNQLLPAIVIVDHITGRATWNNAQRNKQDPLQRIDNYFTSDGKPFAHYTIDPWGAIIQVAYERERPWAQGLSRAQSLKKPPDFWLEYWNKTPWGFSNVAQLLSCLHDTFAFDQAQSRQPPHSPNDRAIAIEHIQYGNGFKLTAAQYRMSHMLHIDIAMRHEMASLHDGGLPAMRRLLQILGHEDVNPWERGTKAGGWDPGALRKKPRFCWYCLTTLDFTHGGRFKRCPAVRDTPKMPEWLKKLRVA